MIKRGVSPVISTTLLVILVLVIVFILASFVLPFVSKNLSAECNEAVNGINFDSSEYNCQTTGNGMSRTGFSVKLNSELIKGFRIGFLRGGELQTYDITEGAIFSNIRMLNGIFNSPLGLPQQGAVKTYAADGLFERIDISPILKSGEQCNVKKSISIPECLNAEVINALLEPIPDSCGNGICEAGSEETCSNCPQDCGTCPAGQCSLTMAEWSTNNAREGESVNLIVEGENCAGKTIGFEVWEYDSLSARDPVNVQPSSVVFGAGGSVQGVWTAEWQEDCFGLCNPPEYYFIARVNEGATEPGIEIESSKADDKLLKVYKCGDKLITHQEECDDGNTIAGDGCYQCTIESGWTCTGQPSSCNPSSCINNPQCQPGQTQQCPAGTTGTQTCSSSCVWQGTCTPINLCGNNLCEAGEPGSCCVDCPGTPGTGGVCAPTGLCGDGYLDAGEECDDGNLINGDGCSSSCNIENGWACIAGQGYWSLCCLINPGSEPNQQNPLCPNGPNEPTPPYNVPPGWPPWMPNPKNMCSNGPGEFSCDHVFGTLFGWQQTSPGSYCPAGTCFAFNNCNLPPPAWCNPGETYYGMQVCCMKAGTISAVIVNCGTCQET